MRLLWACGLLCGAALAASAQSYSVPLWPQGAPDAVGETDADKPVLDVYLPKENPTQAGVVVFPGGGYVRLGLTEEAEPAAAWLNARGAAAFILRYRLAPRYRYPAQLHDGLRAVRYVRAHAAELGLRSDRVAVWGFSAGGHLASLVATSSGTGAPQAADAIERESGRPDLGVYYYALLSLDDTITHAPSKLALLGPQPDPKLVDELSSEKRVTSRTPSSFLLHAAADAVVPVENSKRFYAALTTAGVPAELRVVARGGHGFGLGLGDPLLEAGLGDLEAWLRGAGWLK